MKPLHVRVAEALGCKPSEHPYHSGGTATWWKCECDDGSGEGQHNYRGDGPAYGCLMDYDTDWSATGPLIEKYGIHLAEFKTSDGNVHWIASWPIPATTCERCGHEDNYKRIEVPKLGDLVVNRYPKPLPAVCDLILALKEAGKL